MCAATGRRRARSGSGMRRGFRIVVPLVPAAFALGGSFGVLARASHFGATAAVVMSATTFAGSAQVASVSVLGAGGGIAAAVVARRSDHRRDGRSARRLEACVSAAWATVVVVGAGT